MSVYKHVIFDVDGVLVDSMHSALNNINLIAEQHFPQLPRVASQEDLCTLFSGPLRTSLRRFGLDDSDSRHFFDLHSKKMRLEFDEQGLFCEVLEFINMHLKGRSSIVSSSYSDAIYDRISTFVNSDCFTHILGRELNRKKSDKIKTIAQGQNLTLDEVLYVGDMVSDIMYCKEIGVDVVCVGYGYHPPSYLSVFQPKEVFKNQQDLIDFLSSHLH